MPENIFEHLQKSIEESIKREGSKFAEKHAKYGFWSNPFSDYNYPMTTGFEKLFIGRKKEIEEISNYLVESFLGNGEDTAIIAPIGFGSRSIVNLFKYFIHSLGKKDIPKTYRQIKERFFEVIDYDASSINAQLLAEIMKKTEAAIENQKMLVLTSSFNGKASLIPEPNRINECASERFKRFLTLDIRSKEKTIFLSPWNASAWLYMMEEHPLSISIYENKNILKPLEEAEIVELLKLRIKDARHAGGAEYTIFDDKTLKEIAKFSGGIPRFALQFAYDILEEAIEVKKESIDSGFIHSALDKKGFCPYDEIKTKLKKLIPEPKPWQKKPKAEKIILKLMIYLSGKDVTSTEIAAQIGKSRVAVLENLKKLKKENLIEKEKIESIKVSDSRRKPYRINDFVRAVFENEFIIPEIEKG